MSEPLSNQPSSNPIVVSHFFSPSPSPDEAYSEQGDIVPMSPRTKSPRTISPKAMNPTHNQFTVGSASRPSKQRRTASKQCWLCIYATDTASHTVNALINEHIHCMSLDTIAHQCSLIIEQDIQRRNPCNAAEVQGYAADDIRRHITEHMLNPHVTLALTLRNLVDLNEKLRQNVFSHDPETDATVLDQSSLKHYLAVTAQIASIYKIGEAGRMLFARSGNSNDMANALPTGKASGK